MKNRWIKLGLLILTLVLILCPPRAFGAWAKTNDQYKYSSGDPVSTTAFANALTNPSLIIVGINSLGIDTIATPTDTAGNTYVDCGAGKTLYWSDSLAVQLFYALNTHTTASNVVSIANPENYIYTVVAFEWTGGATSSPIDGTPVGHANGNTGTGGGQNMTAGPTTPTLNGDLIVGMSGLPSGEPTAGTGFTAASRKELEELVQPTAAAISATWSAGNSLNYGAIVAAFKVYAAAPAGRKVRVITD